MRPWLALPLIVVVCALGARFLRAPVAPKGQSLERVRAGLHLFWPGVDTDALLQGQEMHVAVRFPPGTRVRQKQWSYDLVSWLAGHPATVIDAVTGMPVPRTGARRPETPSAREEYWALDQSEKMRAACQSELDRKLGSGATLLLLDMETTGQKVVVPSRPPYETLPVHSGGQLQFDVRSKKVHACLVVTSPDLVEKARLSVDPALDEKRGDELRVVVIP